MTLGNLVVPIASKYIQPYLMHWFDYFFLFIIKQYRVSDLYLKGIAQFLDFAFANASD